jgi:hypothetical protein
MWSVAQAMAYIVHIPDCAIRIARGIVPHANGLFYGGKDPQSSSV